MNSRRKSWLLLLLGSYVLAWALYPFGELMAVHPITWFELFMALLCITLATVELLSRRTDTIRHEFQIRLASLFVTLYLAAAFALLFVGGIDGFWILASSTASATYLLIVAGVGLPLLPAAVLLMSRFAPRREGA